MDDEPRCGKMHVARGMNRANATIPKPPIHHSRESRQMTYVDPHSTLDEQYHDTIAAEYDVVVNEPRRYANDLLFTPVLTDIDSAIDSVLDLGCGTGQMTERLGTRFRPNRIVGVDHSEGMLEVAAERARLLGLTQAEFKRMHILDFLESTSETFSVISCVGALHHLTHDNSRKVIKECRRLLEPGGWLVVAEPVDNASFHSIPSWIHRWNMKSVAARAAYSIDAEEPDEAPLPENFLEETLQVEGFRVRKRRCGIEVFPHNMPPSLLDRLVIRAVNKPYRKSGYVVAILAS